MIYTARVPLDEIFNRLDENVAKVMQPIFAEYGGMECYVLRDELIVHFDREEDLIAWKLRWTPDAIQEAYAAVFSDRIENLSLAFQSMGGIDKLKEMLINRVRSNKRER